MRDWKNTPTEELVRKVAVHGYLMAYHKMPLDLKDNEYYSSILAEIQKRIDNSFSNGYLDGSHDGYERGYTEGRCKFDEYECYG